MAQPTDFVAAVFRHIATIDAPGRSPLYAEIAARAAGDDALISLAAEARAGQPPAYLLFAAVHYLLLSGVGQDPPLTAFYPSITSVAEGRTGDVEGVFPAFRRFCLEHREAIVSLLQTRIMQTAHPRRCTALLPALDVVVRRSGNGQLALIEVGASAGLNLIWDRYAYIYRDSDDAIYRRGDPSSPLLLDCALRGSTRPPLPATFPPIVSRTGLDLRPVDLSNDSEVRWLQALIWPEAENAREVLTAAITLARQDLPSLVAGDALETLPAVLVALPATVTPVVYHSHTLYQFTPEARASLDALLALHAGVSGRSLWRIGVEVETRDTPVINLTHYQQDGREQWRLGRCDPHGAWLEWLDRVDA